MHACKEHFYIRAIIKVSDRLLRLFLRSLPLLLTVKQFEEMSSRCQNSESGKADCMKLKRNCYWSCDQTVLSSHRLNALRNQVWLVDQKKTKSGKKKLISIDCV